MTSLRRDLPLALAALFLWCTGAWAQEHVGDALRIDRSVSAAQGSAVRNLDTGGAVRRTDVLQSDASGRASLQFVDETIVTMGPASSLDVARITLRSDRRATEFVMTPIASTRRLRRWAFAAPSSISTSPIRRPASL